MRRGLHATNLHPHDVVFRVGGELTAVQVGQTAGRRQLVRVVSGSGAGRPRERDVGLNLGGAQVGRARRAVDAEVVRLRCTFVRSRCFRKVYAPRALYLEGVLSAVGRAVQDAPLGLHVAVGVELLDVPRLVVSIGPRGDRKRRAARARHCDALQRIGGSGERQKTARRSRHRPEREQVLVGLGGLPHVHHIIVVVDEAVGFNFGHGDACKTAGDGREDLCVAVRLEGEGGRRGVVHGRRG